MRWLAGVQAKGTGVLWRDMEGRDQTCRCPLAPLFNPPATGPHNHRRRTLRQAELGRLAAALRAGLQIYALQAADAHAAHLRSKPAGPRCLNAAALAPNQMGVAAWQGAGRDHEMMRHPAQRRPGPQRPPRRPAPHQRAPRWVHGQSVARIFAGVELCDLLRLHAACAAQRRDPAAGGRGAVQRKLDTVHPLHNTEKSPDLFLQACALSCAPPFTPWQSDSTARAGQPAAPKPAHLFSMPCPPPPHTYTCSPGGQAMP